MLAQDKNTRGSIMIAALIITLITGTLVGLFLQTVVQEVENTHRARMGFQAVNLAEAGVEYAIHTMVLHGLDVDEDENWVSTAGGGFYRDAFPHIDITDEAQNDDDSRLYRVRSSLRNDNRSLRVYLEPEWVNADGNTVPVVVSEGRVTLNNGMVTSRQILVEMEKGSSKPEKRGWGNGVMGKRNVTLVGGVEIDSYDSENGPYHTLTNRNGNGSVATNSLSIGDLSLGTTTIIGRVAVGASEGKLKKGNVLSMEDYSNGGSGIDYDRVAYDFYVDLPDPVFPTFNSPVTMGKVAEGTIGTAGVETTYVLDEIYVKNKKVLKIEGDVKMIVTGDLQVFGEIRITEGSSLEVYIDGDVDVGGTGIVNLTNKPPNLLMYASGNGAKGQFKLHGSTAFAGAVYAPNSEVLMDGGSEMFGAVVGDTVKFNGNNKFHYDEALNNLDPDNDDDGKFVPMVTAWRELTHAGEKITDWSALRQNGL
jgi:hypothetical protein